MTSTNIAACLLSILICQVTPAMDRKEVSAILLKARKTIESCDKTISEVKEVHRKSAEELKRMSEVLSMGSFRFSVDPIPSDKQDEPASQGVSKVSIGSEDTEHVEPEIKSKRKSRKKSSLASMLRRNQSESYDLSSLTYSLETLKRDDSFNREDQKIKQTPLILVDKSAEVAKAEAAVAAAARAKPKTAQERRQSFAKSNMSRYQKIR